MLKTAPAVFAVEKDYQIMVQTTAPCLVSCTVQGEEYDEWTALLREHVKPHLILCGHMHTLGVRLPGHEKDHHGQPCPVVIGANPDRESYADCGLVFGREKIDTVFTDSAGKAFDGAALAK